MNKSESKYFHTAQLMDEALLLLLEKKDYDYITVKEICAKAGVNRSTFYLHYETIDDLLKESLALLLSRMQEKFGPETLDREKVREASLDELLFITPNYIIPYLEFLSENKKVFLIAIRKPEVFRVTEYFDDLYRSVLDPVLKRFRIEERDHKYVLAFYINGIHAMVTQWIKNGCTEDVRYLADLIIRYIVPQEKRGAL